MEQEISGLANAVNRWTLPSTKWESEAKRRLNLKLEQIELSLATPSPVPQLRIGAWTTAAAVSLGFCMAVWWLSFTPQVSPPDPIDTISRVVLAETTLFRPAVEEKLAIVVEEMRPRRVARRSRLDAIADPLTGRFTSSLRGEDGILKQALWKSDDHSELVYEPGYSRKLVRRSVAHKNDLLMSVGDQGLDSDQLEAAFVHWLETRSWQPISLTTDFALWARQDGTVLSLEKFQHPSGQTTVRITAQRNNGRKGLAMWTVEVDAATYRPREQTLYFKEDGREAEVRVMATSINEIPRAALKPIMFLPTSSQLRAPAEQSSVERKRIAPLPLLPANARMLDQQENLAGRIEALYALHQAGACLGVGVQISQSEEGLLIGRRSNSADPINVLSTAATLEEALAALSDVRKPIRDKGAGPTTDMQRHAAALRLLARTIASTDNGDIPDLSWKLVEAMFLDHTVGLGHSLERIAAASVNRQLPVDDVRPLFDASTSLQSRLSRFGIALEALDPQHPGAEVLKLQAELEAIEAEYRAIFSKRNGHRSVAKSF